LIGKKIVEYEYQGMSRTEYYGDRLIEKLAEDLTTKLGRGFGKSNVFLMKSFYLSYPNIFQTPSGKSSGSANIRQTSSGKSLSDIMQTPYAQSLMVELSSKFLLPWSHYVRLLSVKDADARNFYETEALRSGWSVRQLDRQISSQFYERALLSKNKTAMLKKGVKHLSQEILSAEEELKDPYILEFLGLKDEYSENDLEEALIDHLEKFLLELGSDFAFLGKQKRLRIGNAWYRVDLIFFHRKLRCIVIIDLKVGKFTHADAGQMHLYLNYAKEYWTNKNENPPVGLILCAEKDSAVAKYALDGLPNKILASEYKLALPDEKLLQKELEKTLKWLYKRKNIKDVVKRSRKY
jgi:predicted nuclease of restriction endonuclease-like (RecB) superfamily